MNIHVRLDKQLNNQVLKYCAQIKRYAPNDQIDFVNTQYPHVTLYLTQFMDNATNTIIQTVMNLLPNLPINCPIMMQNVTVQGGYALWNAENDKGSCIQTMSDTIVSALAQYIVPNQRIPSWVLQLPEPLRSEKIAMIKKYGSPNVLSQFQPHVTLACDTVDDLPSAMSHVNVVPAEFVPPYLGLGVVGACGSVLQQGGWGLFPLNL
jgi:hypothetical protein